METSEAVYQATLDALRQNQPACVLTIVEVSGSTPRGVGAKMLLRADGSTIGSIGGGALEAAALEDSREAMDSGESRLEAYSVRGQDDGALGICGGDARVFIEVIRTRRTLLIAGAACHFPAGTSPLSPAAGSVGDQHGFASVCLARILTARTQQSFSPPKPSFAKR